jgi:hypothetical protein
MVSDIKEWNTDTSIAVIEKRRIIAYHTLENRENFKSSIIKTIFYE